MTRGCSVVCLHLYKPTSLSCRDLITTIILHLGMLSRQCRARLSYRNRTSSTASTLFAAPASFPRKRIITSPFPVKSHVACRLGQSRNYALASDLDRQDSSPPLLPFSHHAPSPSPSSEPPAHLENLRVHLAASLLPLHQPLSIAPSSAGQRLHTRQESEDGTSGHQATIFIPIDDGLGESALGIVSPFEGGDCYNRGAVLETASCLGADVVRIDLALAVGLSESLGIKGKSETRG